ncbi:putative TetR family transcriptional regulator [Gordonia araii NBRC 100433]|uniref:Putative TetR family transcriptional regulator n=1 Tax=Gordonia araii NBRC 100433 TaxID=1073574 RepID=G7GZ21_9ACTN|nr:TetR family transcriptional regulator [Gordonia araii]NNG97054.1 TetR family transcriptional regulator [Gordonia araii NBRC 100433]GAB08846.1 putative TetR family transcriptional regulator [Gordonia araii NBRC 100433]
MATTHTDGGVRAAKKARTRAAIRAAAVDLFAKQGFAATTVEQIAQTAGVSHTTFFRYFQSKEQVIISDDLQEQRDAALAAIPPGLNHFDLLRRMISDLFEIALADKWASCHERVELINSEPELHRANQVEAERAISEAAEFIADYAGVPADDLHLQVFVAAISGVMFYIANSQEVIDHEEALARLLAAIDLLERGLPLRG